MKQQIESLLRTYLEKKARIKSLELDIENLRNTLDHQGQVYIEPLADAIEGMSMKAKSITDMPTGGQSEYQSSTERVALTCRRVHNNSFDTEDIHIKINELTNKINELMPDVERVDIFLSGLTDREKFIADKFYINAWTWEEVTYYYNEHMPVTKQKRALKDVRDDLLNKIERISA
jgi:predicted RNase H-like nuclease (RuvC/YqgF family)